MNVPPVLQATLPKTDDQWHGLANGLDQLDKEAYEALVSSEEMLQFLTQKLEEKKQLYITLTDEIKQAKKLKAQKEEDGWSHQEKINLSEEELDRLQSKNNKIQDEISSLRDWNISQKPITGAFMGWIYFIAGWVFILGDLIISHEIVAYALQIRGQFESWAFAVGLALLSILLKPAYDHWIEKPNQPGVKGKGYRTFHALIAFLTILTVGILGWFRFEAYQVEQQKMEVNRQLRQWQLQEDSIADTAFPPLVMEKMEKLSSLSMSLVDSPKALVSFVLSGLLFAIAGAICLGMSLPILHYYFEKWTKTNPRLKNLTRKHENLEIEIKELTQTKIKHQWAYQACLAWKMDENLEADRIFLQQEMDSLREKITRARENIRISQYSEGYQRGLLARKTISSEELHQWRQNWATPPKNPDTSYSFSSFLHS